VESSLTFPWAFRTIFIYCVLKNNRVLKKKILQIGIEVNSGSTGKIAEQIGSVAIKNGFESYITYARGFNPSESNVIKIGNKLSIFLHLLRTRFCGDHLNGSKFATLKLIKKIKSIQPDIIHLHQIHGYFLNVPLLFNFLKEYNKPVVWTLHDCWAFTGHCTYFSIEKCNKWTSECNNCPKINNYPKSIHIDNSKSEFYTKKKLFNGLQDLTIVGVSNWMANQAKMSFLNINTTEITTVLNGVDTSLFYPRKNRKQILDKYNLEQNKNFVITAGTTWLKAKGLDDYQNLSKILPDNIQLIMVGVDSNLKSKLPSNIKCFKRTESQDELAELYSISEILLCLSYQESFGLTPIEAMACGTPAIVYDNTALSELIIKNTGELVETGNIELVLAKINKMLNKGKMFYYKACIDRAKRKYEKEITYENYIKIYKKLLK
jgi:putative colanic acid biosynthesis glycosyltransferase